MITVSRDIISKSVAPNKAMDIMRRDSDGDDYLPKSHKKKKSRNSKRSTRDPFHQISMDDLNRDSDEESKANNSSTNLAGSNSVSVDTLTVNKHKNETDKTFDKQQVTPTIGAKSALSAMMESTRDGLNMEASEFAQRMTIAQNRYQGGRHMANMPMTNGTTTLSRHNSSNANRDAVPQRRGKRSTIHAADQGPMIGGGRQKRKTIGRGDMKNMPNADQDYDSSDSDERILQKHGNPLDTTLGTYSSGQGNMNSMLVYIEEFKNDQPVRVSTYKKQNVNFPKTANDFIVEVYNKCIEANRILKGASVGDYVLREWDDDEPGDLTMDGTAKISELKYCDAVCICYVGSGNGTVGGARSNGNNGFVARNDSKSSLMDATKQLNHQRSLSPDMPDDARKTRSVTLDHLNQNYGKQAKVFVRIQVPGPMNDTFTFQIENESAALNVRDLCMYLNKKKNQIYFNPQYFDFYYQGLTSNGLEGPINKQTKVLDLKKRELVVLPKIIKSDDSTEEKEIAFAYPLVKLANQVSKVKAFKIKNSQKKARLLSIDRHRIVKQSLDDDKFKIMRRNEKVPIDIVAITNIKINSENNAQFILHYNHPNGGNRKHVYEMASKQECSHCVSKIKYLVTLRRLQGQ